MPFQRMMFHRAHIIDFTAAESSGLTSTTTTTSR